MRVDESTDREGDERMIRLQTANQVSTVSYNQIRDVIIEIGDDEIKDIPFQVCRAIDNLGKVIPENKITQRGGKSRRG